MNVHVQNIFFLILRKITGVLYQQNNLKETIQRQYMEMPWCRQWIKLSFWYVEPENLRNIAISINKYDPFAICCYFFQLRTFSVVDKICLKSLTITAFFL